MALLYWRLLSIYVWGPGLKPRFIGGSSVADPHHLDADRDPDPAFHFDADPNPAFQFDADSDPGPTTHLFPDLDPPLLQNGPQRLSHFHFVANPDPDPAFSLIWIQLLKIMRIRIRHTA
jgi:hypothetical protein